MANPHQIQVATKRSSVFNKSEPVYHVYNDSNIWSKHSSKVLKIPMQHTYTMQVSKCINFQDMTQHVHAGEECFTFDLEKAGRFEVRAMVTCLTV